MDERIFTEARLKAEEMLPAVDTALEALGEEVSRRGARHNFLNHSKNPRRHRDTIQL
jgi:flagellin-like hook-associated protein FlgL